jgi:L-ribulose-5-phosphate 4-epimerase
MYEEIRKRVLVAAQNAEKANLCKSGGGNFSMIDRDKGLIFITPHDTDRFTMSCRDVVVMDMDGNIVEISDGVSPSSEKLIHLEIYKKRPDVMAVCHNHAPYTSVFAALSMEIKPVLTEAMMFNCRCPLAPYGKPSTMELAENVVKTLGDKGVAAVMERHGLITVSQKDIEDAVRKSVYVEETAKAYYRMANLVGLENIHCMPVEEYDKLIDMLKIK